MTTDHTVSNSPETDEGWAARPPARSDWRAPTAMFGVLSILLWLLAAYEAQTDHLSILDSLMPYIACAFAASMATFTIAAMGVLSYLDRP